MEHVGSGRRGKEGKGGKFKVVCTFCPRWVSYVGRGKKQDDTHHAQDQGEQRKY